MEFSTCFLNRLLGLDCWIDRSDFDSLNRLNAITKKPEVGFIIWDQIWTFKQKRCPIEQFCVKKLNCLFSQKLANLSHLLCQISQKPEGGFKICQLLSFDEFNLVRRTGSITLCRILLTLSTAHVQSLACQPIYFNIFHNLIS